MRFTAARTAASGSPPACEAMSAAMTSLSELPRKRTPWSSSSARSSPALSRLPLCPSATLKPRCSCTSGWAFSQLDDPVVE